MRLHSAVPALAVPLLFLPLAACNGGEGGSSAGFAVRDSAGIHIVENTAPQWKEGAGWTLSAEPTLDIGVVDGAKEYQLSQVRDALRLASGQIAVANAGSQEIRFFDGSGKYLRSVGGEGGGPGEFKDVSWIRALPGDTLVAYDGRQRRLSTFDPQGMFVGSTNLELKAEKGYLSPVGQFADGTLFVQLGQAYGPGEVKSGVVRDSVSYLRYSTAGALLNPVIRLRGSEAFVESDEKSLSVSSLIFGRSSQYALAGTRVFAADNDAYEIGLYGMDGKLVELIRRRAEARPVTRADFDAMVQKRTESMGNSSFNSSLRQRFNDMMAKMPLPSTLPAFSNLETDLEGNLWVQEYPAPAAEGTEWTVFDPEGRMLGAVSMPDRFRPMRIGGDSVLGVWKDDLDVEHVRMYRLEKQKARES
jgi:hypothetical protein